MYKANDDAFAKQLNGVISFHQTNWKAKAVTVIFPASAPVPHMLPYPHTMQLSASEMTIVSGGALNSTHSLTMHAASHEF